MKQRRLTGFSLIEVIVAGALIATTLGALFTIASVTTRATIMGQERIIASQLAREGIEAVRQVRDVNFVGEHCTTTCPSWHSGVVATLPTSPIGLQIDLPSVGAKSFALTSVPLPFSCTDYLIRDLVTGQFKSVSHVAVALNAKEQLFCRRVLIEPIADVSVVGSTLSENTEAFRVRSQVAWLGYGKDTLRTMGAASVMSCDASASEWCTEEVTVLTNWRPSL